MSDVTVVTNADGKIAAIGHGRLSEASAKRAGINGPAGGLFALPGQKLQELQMAEDLTKAKDFEELHNKVQQALSKR
ncbi:MAG: hypothetical protein JO122_17845 [Acetobacteraceae bacterium]|nr:hypothetical protein [Acetobacteraceae bacterium]